jgi:hypothetical protein
MPWPLTERLLADPLSLQLPRKYKIAFAACAKDCAGRDGSRCRLHRARQNGVDGFAVYVAGGMGGKSRLSSLLHEFIPASDAFVVAEAIKRVFDKNGDRKNKHLARLRFLVEKIGLPAFRELYESRTGRCAPAIPRRWKMRPLPQLRRQRKKGEVKSDSAEFNRWFAHNVAPQKQPGFFLVQIPLTLGDLPGQQNRRARGHSGGARRQHSLGHAIAKRRPALDHGGGIAGGASETRGARPGRTRSAGAAQSRRVRRGFDLPPRHLPFARTRQGGAAAN